MPDFSDISIDSNVRPGDIGTIIHLHGALYAAEHGFDNTFEAYVAGPMSDFVHKASPRERIWIARRGLEIVGCTAIVTAKPQTAQLRWLLVHPAVRGRGLGRALIDQAAAFSGAQGYDSVILWTISALTDAARLYVAAGFRKIEERPGRHWGIDVVEECYELQLR